jgi:competence protein ComEC
MPRTAWAGLGAVDAALLAQALPMALPGMAPTAWGAVTVVLGLVSMAGMARVAPRTRGAIGAMTIGAALILLRLALGALVQPVAAPVALPDGPVDWTATVASVSAPAGATQRAVVDGTAGDAPGSVRLWLLLPRYPAVVPGDRIHFRAPATTPPSDDPGFAGYLAGIGASGTAAPPEVDLLAPDGGPAAALERLRREMAGWLATALPEPQAGLAAGLLLGLRDLVPRDVSADFTAAGLNHVIAIDGWKVALVAGLIGVLVRPLPRRRRAAALALGIIGYALLAGAGASVLRAALMALTGLIARETGRPRSAAAALGLAVLSLLMLEPALGGDPGFHLSAAATAGLIAWSGPTAAWLRARVPPRVPTVVLGWTAVSLVAQAVSVPVVLVDFGQFSPAAPLANILVAPLVPPVVLVVLAALATGALLSAGAPHLLGVPVSVAGGALLGALTGFAHAVAAIPFATVPLDGPSSIAAGLGATLALLAVSRPGVRGRLTRLARRGPPPPARAPRPPGTPPAPGGLVSRRQVLALLALPVVAASAGMLVATRRADGRLRATVLDVGQGDAILIEGDRGARLLVDGGPDPDRLLALLDAQLPPWDRRLDVLVLTHPHEDHVGGFAALLGRYRVGPIFEPGMLGPGPAYHAFEAALRDAGRGTLRLADGDTLRLDDATIRVHWPVAGSVPRLPPDTGKGINDVSIVLDIRFGQRRLLLMGDTEEEVDPQLLEAGLAGPIDVLKVAHHGSGTASTAPFLAAVRPRVAVVSVGAGNPYGHPAPATIARLRAAGAAVYRTDLDGSVEISTDGRDLEVRPAGARRVATPSATGPVLPAMPGPAWPAAELATIGAWPSPPVSRPWPSSSTSTPPPAS